MKPEEKLAKFLLEIDAVKIDTKKLFTWTSGWKSPFYCDNRITLSFVNIRNFIKKFFVEKILKQFSNVEVIAGVATSGIPYASLVADYLNLPLIYVRPKPKSHGLQKQIEGFFKENQKIVVIEDLISTAQSALSAVKILRENKAYVLGVGAIFSYEFDVAKKNFEKEQTDYFSLTNYSILIKTAIEMNYITKEQIEFLDKWQQNPENFTL